MYTIFYRVPYSRQIVFALAIFLFLFAFLATSSRAQVAAPPVYPGITPAKPLFDLPLIAPSVWPNQLASLSGTCQAPVRMMRNCSYMRLVYANSTNTEPWSVAPNAITIRASLVVLRPGQPASIRPVTFNGGNAEITLGQETAIVSDIIPEYWNTAENAKAYVRTYVRLPVPTAKAPVFTYFSPLTGEGARWVSSTTAPQDLTLDPWPSAAFTAVPETQQAFYPVAIIGDADPASPSVAFIGSSSTASLDSFAAVGLNRLNIPYIILSTSGWSIWQYEAAALRARIDASCTHIIEQYGRNDIGVDYNPAATVSQYLDPIKTRMTRLWQRHKMQGAWVAQVTAQPRVAVMAPSSYADPSLQTPTPVEEPLRQPLNAWIRDQVTAANSPLDFVYELGDTVEYFESGVRTNRWKYILNPLGAQIPLTSDGLHLNINGVNLAASLFTPEQFRFDSRDWVAPALGSAIIPKSGTTVVLEFNEARNAPLLGVNTGSGFRVLVNNAPRTLYRAQLTGPKQVTLWLSGKPFSQSDQVQVGFTPGVGKITDSAPSPNALTAFDNQPVWNNSLYVGTETAAAVAVTAVTARRVNGQVEVTLSLQNTGGTSVSLMEILTANLHNSTTLTPLPLPVGEIAPQGTQSVTLAFPDMHNIRNRKFKLTGQHTQGKITFSSTITVP